MQEARYKISVYDLWRYKSGHVSNFPENDLTLWKDGRLEATHLPIFHPSILPHKKCKEVSETCPPLKVFMKIYEDAVSYVRKSPERVFRTGIPDPIELITHIVGDALIAGATEICTLRVGDWWVIGSNVDWLMTQKQYSVKELFVRIVPLPEAGSNSMRAEILLTAFAEAVITVSGNACLTLKGDVAKGAEIWHVMKSRSHLKRCLAFRLNCHQTGSQNV